MIVRIKGREKTKQDLKVRLSKAMLRLGGEVRLGKALLRLCRSESSKTQALGSPKRGFLSQGGDLCLRERSYA